MNKNYIPLYRKYRPQTIEQIVGQEHIKKALANAIEMNRISHAYLFTGPRGTGKTSTARIFAKSLNCEKDQQLILVMSAKIVAILLIQFLLMLLKLMRLVIVL